MKIKIENYSSDYTGASSEHFIGVQDVAVTFKHITFVVSTPYHTKFQKYLNDNLFTYSVNNYGDVVEFKVVMKNDFTIRL